MDGNGVVAHLEAPAPISVPRRSKGVSRGRIFLLAGAAVLVLGGAVGAYVVFAHPFQKTRTDLVLHKVAYETLDRTVIERGALESANNSDVFCRVKAGSKNTTVSTTIKWLVDDGSQVMRDRPKDQIRSIISWDEKSANYTEKIINPNASARVVEVKDPDSSQVFLSDLLVDLDDSGLQEQLKAEKILLDTDAANKIQAEENYKIQVAQNESDIKAAEIALDLAKIDLQKYVEGDYPAKLKDYEGQVSLAESDVEEQRDRVAWAQRMVKKGYYTVSQSQAEQSKLDGFEQTMRLKRENLRVLTDPIFGERKRFETQYKSAVAQAEREVNRIKGKALGMEIQARTDRETKKSIWVQEQSHYNDIVAEIRKCKIYAPQDGMVVYYLPEQARYGGGAQQSMVAQGEPVREGQKLMQIPDLTHMLVNTKVHEALVSHVHSGQPAQVRTESFPDRPLQGHVDTVSTVSSQLDFWSSDVKVYTTKVSIDEPLSGLKPGMSAEVTITIGDPLKHVLTVPIEAVVGSAELGKRRDVYVAVPNGTEKRSVLIGSSNETMVEIKEGLNEGDEVVLNPRVILGEQTKTRQPGSGNKASQDENSGPGDKKGRGKKGQRGPGGPGPDGMPSDGTAGPRDRTTSDSHGNGTQGALDPAGRENTGDGFQRRAAEKGNPRPDKIPVKN